MKKLVVLKLDGDFEQGFRVSLEVGEEGKQPSTDINGKLPPCLAIPEYYERWRFSYRSLNGRTRIKSKNGQTTNVSFTRACSDCSQAAKELSDRFNTWLLSDSFRDLREKCIEHFTLSAEDQIRVIVRTSCRTLQQLPWHQWDLVKRYGQIEIAISPPESKCQGKNKTSTDSNKVRILAILGHSGGINIQKDQKMLEQLPGVDIRFLVEPQRQEINDQLWEQAWDILFFAGHSETEAQTGRIYINRTESLSVGDLKHGLEIAVKKGLQLAIFNSCDGMGLAWELEELHIPQAIVMREPVADRVAQEFLKYFLQAFVGEKSLYQAVGNARKRLQGLENQFPCASWLPAIYQNAAAVPQTWYSLRYGNQQASRLRILRTALVASVVVTALVLGVRHFGLLQSLELQAYDQLMRLRPDEQPDDRLLVVTITEEDLNYQDKMGMKRQGSLSDAALAQLLKKLEPHQPSAIGLDIYRDFQVSDGHKDLATKLRQSDRFFAVCQGSNPTNGHIGVAPPPEVPKDRLGFSDVVVDPHNILRRHWWYATFNSDSLCPAELSFSLQLALYYLIQEKGIKVRETPEGYLQVGNISLKPWHFPAGGYQQEEDLGYQMLLNYRTRGNIARSITLTEVLKGKFDPNWVKDRIVLIGVTAKSQKDDFFTPFSRDPDQTMRGIFVQGQMISQILSAVLDGRPLLSVWQWWEEAFWVLGWAIGGGLLAWHYRQLKYLLPAGGIVIFILSGVCFILLIRGWWVPLVPSVLVLIVTGGWVVLVARQVI
ncbi:CHASE2 domain-containing protein [Fischerella thermalis]|uniref:CHASE2 domain-containing protein n=1 Tax=Fischerella thermalis TaxID=372787 RepID=UPI000E0A4973|nr:CHASE2 domain-containing protein [Fischerella thermalis]RDH49453.1 hypothetical protein CA946_10920 [Fischerella thermalis 111/344/542]